LSGSLMFTGELSLAASGGVLERAEERAEERLRCVRDCTRCGNK